MEIRKIKAQTVCDTVKKLFTDCNYFIGKDIMCALETARDNESSPVGKVYFHRLSKTIKLRLVKKFRFVRIRVWLSFLLIR